VKTCTKCNIEKNKAEFHKDNSRKDRLHPNCKACNNSRKAEWVKRNPIKVAAHYSENKEKYKSYRAAYDVANADSVRISRRLRYLANPEKERARIAAWQDANPEKRLEIDRNRRARKAGSAGRHTAKDVHDIFSLQRGLCANCMSPLLKSGKNKFHADHVMPLALGGSNGKENLQCLCPSCNLRKHAKDPIAWAQENGRLL